MELGLLKYPLEVVVKGSYVFLVYSITSAFYNFFDQFRLHPAVVLVFLRFRPLLFELSVIRLFPDDSSSHRLHSLLPKKRGKILTSSLHI